MLVFCHCNYVICAWLRHFTHDCANPHTMPQQGLLFWLRLTPIVPFPLIYTASPIHRMRVQATGKKPAWETGARMALPRKVGTAQAPAKKSAWNISPDEDDAELLDDSELLTEEDLQRPAVPCTSFFFSRLIVAFKACDPSPCGLF